MEALVPQQVNTAPVNRAFAEFVSKFHELLSEGPYEALVTWKLQETRFAIRPRRKDLKSEFNELSFTLKLKNDGGVLNIDVLKPNEAVDTADMLHKYIAYLQARLGAQRDMQVVRIENDATHVSFCCMGPSDGAKGVRGSIMLHMLHLVAGALIVCWRPMPQVWYFCDFLKRAIQNPQANARPMLSLDAAGGGPGRPEPNSRPVPSLDAAGGGPGPSSGPNPGKRVAPQDNGQARQVVQKKLDPKVSGVFGKCKTMQEALELFKRSFPGVVDYDFRGDYARKKREHKAILDSFVSTMEELWKSGELNIDRYPRHGNLLGLSLRIEHHETTLDNMLTEILFSPRRRFALTTANLTFLLPSISKVAEKWAWTLKSDALIAEMKRELRPVFEKTTEQACSKHIRDATQRLTMSYGTTSKGVEWTILFEINRSAHLSSEAWEKEREIFINVFFVSAGIAEIMVVPRMKHGQSARLPTTLTDIVARRCSWDCPCGPWPIMTQFDAARGLGIKMERHYPYMLTLQHILSVVYTLLGVVTNDVSKLGTDGPGIFPVPAGDGGPGN